MRWRKGAYVARRSTALPMMVSPPAWGWVDTPSTILRNPPFACGGVRVKRGSCPAAGAGGHPPHRYIIHRAQAFPQRHSQPSPWGGPTGEKGQPLPSSGRAASSSAQLPDQLCAGHRPGHARCSTQHGGSDHRRPSNVETMTSAHPPVSPPKRHLKSLTQLSPVESCIPLSTGVAWAA